jgi:hypothetical protein
MSESLQQAQELIYGAENKKTRDELSQNIAHVYRQTCEKHHHDLLRRKHLIEEQKEMYERIQLEREQAEREEKERRQKQEERERIISTKIYPKFDKTIGIAELNEDESAMEKDDEVKQQIERAKRELKELNEVKEANLKGITIICITDETQDKLISFKV